MHVRGAVVESHGDTAAAKVLDIATKALGLLVVTDDADSNALKRKCCTHSRR